MFAVKQTVRFVGFCQDRFQYMLINLCVFAGLDANRSESERAPHMQIYSETAPEMLMLFLKST